VRINAQLPELEEALTRSGVPFAIRGQRFFDRREIREARRLLRGAAWDAVGAPLVTEVRKLFEARLGLGGDAEREGNEAAERSASLETFVSIVADLATARPEVTLPDVLAELDRRDAEEASGASGGVNMLTYHRAKGLEWDAVFLPALEEGLLPIRQAKEDLEVDEERRFALCRDDPRPDAPRAVVGAEPSRRRRQGGQAPKIALPDLPRTRANE